MMPTNLSLSFPDLIGISADFCSIKMVFKENFKNLNKLKELWLSNNQIEKVMGNTFEDLTSLEWLYLREEHFRSLFLYFLRIVLTQMITRSSS